MDDNLEIIHRLTIVSADGKKQYGIYHPPEPMDSIMQCRKHQAGHLSPQDREYLNIMNDITELLEPVSPECKSIFGVSTISFFSAPTYAKGASLFRALAKVVEHYGYKVKDVSCIRFSPDILRPLYEDSTQVIYERQPYFTAVREFLVNHGVSIQEDS